jgi:hypothetical protein
MSLRSASGARTAGLAMRLAPVLVLAACSTPLGSDDSSRSPSASPTVSSAGADLDLSRLPVPRRAFCDILPRKDVTAALDGPVVKTAHYDNGDEFEVRPGYRDVSHEYGCVFEGGDGTLAKTWVFARPVLAREARMLVRRERRGRDCAFPDPVRFGRPHLASVCEVPGGAGSDRAVRARLEGLFGDSWLACEVSEPLERASATRGPRADVMQRAVDWCTGVVTAVGAS